MVTQNKKILIITGSFGNGHMQVTQSIVNQLNEMNLNHLSVIQHDLFMEAHPIMTSICKNGISIALNILEIHINDFTIVALMSSINVFINIMD